MIVALDIDRPRVWHLRLAEQIKAAGHEAFLRQGQRAGLARAATVVLGAERRLYGAVSEGFAPAAVALAASSTSCDLAIKLDQSDAGEGLEVLFDGASGDAALVDALMKGAAPLIAVRRRGTAETLALGLPAIEDPSILARALDPVLERTATLVVQAVARLAAGATNEQGVSRPTPTPASKVSVPLFLLRGLVSKLSRRYGPSWGRPDPWRIAYRPVRGAPGVEPLDQGFVGLDPDHRRFRADPFPFEDAGRRFVFFEDYPYPSRKGVIGVVEIDADGRATAPQTVLELPWHISYPFVFRHGDDVFMMPEMSGAGRIQLFRAEALPDRWVADRILIDDVPGSDPTMVQFGDLWWIFATVRGAQGSSWDQLCLFHAPSPFGPWMPHKANPVLIDAGSARPGGAMWIEDGKLMRVAQDCRRRYGDGLVICRVDRLDTEGFRQTITRRVVAPTGYDADGVHTLSRSETLEAIDLRYCGAGRSFPLLSLFGNSSRTGA